MTHVETAKCQNPVWSTEIVTKLDTVHAGITEFTDTSHAGIVFVQNSKLIVYEVHRDEGQLSSGTPEETLRPFRLRLSLLDSTTGKVVAGRIEKTRVQDATVLTTVAGLLVKTGAQLELQSPDLAQSRDISFLLNRDRNSRINVSSTGMTIVLNEVIQDSLNHLHSHFDVLDAQTLRVRHSWDQSPPLYHSYSVSDQGIAAISFWDDSIVVANFGASRWPKVGEPTGRCANQNMPTLCNDRQLIYGCDKLIGTSTDGSIFMTDSFPSGNSPSEKTAVAQNGRFVAIGLNTIEIKNRFFRESSRRITAAHIVVYDLALKKQILILNVQPLPTSYYDFALFPDGSELAVLNDRTVAAYSVPIPRRSRTITDTESTP